MTRGLFLRDGRGRIRCYLFDDDPEGCVGVPWATHWQDAVPLCDGHDWRPSKLLREIFEEANDD